MMRGLGDPDRDIEERLLQFHRSVYKSNPFDFDETMRCVYTAPGGYVVVDPQLVSDGSLWHLYYVTGRIEYADRWIGLIRALDFEGARKMPYEEGDGHAVGESLNSLRFDSIILNDPPGDYGYGLQGDSAIVRLGQTWMNLYSARGPKGTSLCIARSNDLFTWRYEARNPMAWPPNWAMNPGKYGAAFIVPFEKQFLVYVQCITKTGLGAVQLLTTVDFESFTDHGPVFQAPLQLRGTFSVESPCVVERDGLWHLFVTHGTGTWHTVSPRPDRFLSPPRRQQFVAGSGTYYVGPYHAARVFRTPNNSWYIIATRKEEQRRRNRESGFETFRGEGNDEKALLQGLFLGRVRWDGDLPYVERIRDDEEIP